MKYLSVFLFSFFIVVAQQKDPDVPPPNFDGKYEISIVNESKNESGNGYLSLVIGYLNEKVEHSQTIKIDRDNSPFMSVYLLSTPIGEDRFSVSVVFCRLVDDYGYHILFTNHTPEEAATVIYDRITNFILRGDQSMDY